MTDGIIFSYAAHFSSGIFPLEIFGHTESNHPVLICISITSLTAPMHSRAQDGVPPRCCAINMCCNLTSTLPPWKETLECQAFVKWKGDEDIARHFPPDSKTKQIHSSLKLHNGIPESFTRVGSNCLQPSDHRIMWPPNVCWKPNCQIRWVVKVWRFVGHNSEVLTVKWSKQRRQRSTDGFTIESQKQTELIW